MNEQDRIETMQLTKNRRHIQIVNLLCHRALPLQDICDVYKKPSDLKIKIYYDCINKIEIIAQDLHLRLIDRGIMFANSHTFTMVAILRDEEKEYYLYMTKDNIYLYTKGVLYAKL